MLPGLDLAPSLQDIFVNYLYGPKIVQLGEYLGYSALASATSTALGAMIDANSSSMYKDLSRLAIAAYIATANTLTDTSLNGLDCTQHLPSNIARDADSKPLNDVGGFVVWSQDVSTMSVKALILIPVFTVALAAIYFALMAWSPLRRVRALEARVLHRTLQKQFPEAKPFRDGSWTT